jgi:hypothetical protein
MGAAAAREPAARWLGEVSYGVFLHHALVIALAVKAFGFTADRETSTFLDWRRSPSREPGGRLALEQIFRGAGAPLGTLPLCAVDAGLPSGRDYTHRERP